MKRRKLDVQTTAIANFPTLGLCVGVSEIDPFQTVCGDQVEVAVSAEITTEGPMKTLKCDLCDHEAQGETFEEWMQALMPHYMEVHADVMKDSTKGEEERNRWMAENRARFDAA